MSAKIRQDEGGGGMCQFVTEWLHNEFGWNRTAVTYLGQDMQVISDGHLISVLPGLKLLDPTADQFGEGQDIRLLKPGDPHYSRYRPEFDQDYNPVVTAGLSAWRAHWDGRDDRVRAEQVSNGRGIAWWLNDTALYVDFWRQQCQLASAKRDCGYAAFCRKTADGAANRKELSPGPSPT